MPQRSGAPRRIAAGARTNVPPWPAPAAPELDPAARRYTLVDVGGEGSAVTVHWRAARPDATVLELDPWRSTDDDARYARHVGDLVADALIGDRIAVAGAEADVLLVQAMLLEGGFVPDELRTHRTSNDDIRLWCVHCGSCRRVTARPAEVVPCAPCGFDLVVHHHFSARMAAYLGFRVDAETAH